MTSPRSKSPLKSQPLRPNVAPQQTDDNGQSSSSRSLSARATAIRAAHRFTTSSHDNNDDNHQDFGISPRSTTEINESPFKTPPSSNDGHTSRITTTKTGNSVQSHSNQGQGLRPTFSTSTSSIHSGHSGTSSSTTPTPTPAVPAAAQIRFRAPRKSIDAGRLARMQSNPSQSSQSPLSSPALSPFSQSSHLPNMNKGAGVGGGGGGMKAGGSKLKYKWLSQGGGTGDEPGVDVKSRRDEEAYGHLKGKTNVTVVDYMNFDESSIPPNATPGGVGGSMDGNGNGEFDENQVDLDMEMNVRIDFPGERLKDWLEEEGKRKVGEDGKPVGVRWSKSFLSLSISLFMREACVFVLSSLFNCSPTFVRGES